AVSFGVGVGDGEDAAMSGSFNAFRSASRIMKVPSRSSVRANHVPLPAATPTNNLWEILSSGEVINVIVSCGLSKPCWATVGPAQRAARKLARVVSTD